MSMQCIGQIDYLVREPCGKPEECSVVLHSQDLSERQ